MSLKASRKFISFNPDRFQKPLVNFILFPCTITFAVLFIYIGFLYYDVNNRIYSSRLANPLMIDQKILSIIVILWVLLFFVLWWAYRVSSQLMGSFERIIREMDECLAGKSRKHIYSRDKDLLSQELLKRINALIDRLP